jgi:hypothetical protein
MEWWSPEMVNCKRKRGQKKTKSSFLGLERVLGRGIGGRELRIEDSWTPMAHAYKPSYSGDRDQEHQGLKPTQANSSQDSIYKIPNRKRTGGGVQGVHPEFKPWYCKKKKK